MGPVDGNILLLPKDLRQTQLDLLILCDFHYRYSEAAVGVLSHFPRRPIRGDQLRTGFEVC
jgi:hypothetical protein